MIYFAETEAADKCFITTSFPFSREFVSLISYQCDNRIVNNSNRDYIAATITNMYRIRIISLSSRVGTSERTFNLAFPFDLRGSQSIKSRKRR